MKKKKSIRKKIGIVVLVLIISFWVLVFFMTDKNPVWCNLSLGTYDLQQGGFGGGSFPGGYDQLDVYGCEGGIFGFIDKKRYYSILKKLFEEEKIDAEDIKAKAQESEKFYKKDYQVGQIYYENTVSVFEESPSIPLCTDTKDQALKWSELSSQNSSVSRKIIEESETEKYYQFKKVDERYPANILLSRIHKCSYLDRTNSEVIPSTVYEPQYKEKGTGIFIGIFNKRPITLESVKELIPYLRHSLIVYNNNTVIASSINEKHNLIEFEIYEAERYGMFGAPDSFRIIKSKYLVDKDSGEIHLFIGLVKNSKKYLEIY